MSQLLNFFSYLVPLGATVDDVRSNIVTSLTSCGWRIVGNVIPYQSVLTGGTGPWVSPANAFDEWGQSETYGGSPGWIAVKVATAVEIKSYEFTRFGTLVGNDYVAPRDWTIEWADDVAGSPGAWTVCDTRTNEPAYVGRGATDIKSYTIGGSPGAHQYWRLNLGSAANISYQAYLSSLRFFTAASTPSVPEWIAKDQCIYVAPPVTETVGDANQYDALRIVFESSKISFFGTPILKVASPQTIHVRENVAGAVAYQLQLQSQTPFAITASIAGSVMTVTSTAGVIGVGTVIKGGGAYGNTYVASLGTGTGGNGTYNLNYANTTLTSRSYTAYPASTIAGATGTAGSTAKENLRALYVALRNSVDPVFSNWDWFYSKPPPQNADDNYDYIVGVCKTSFPNATPIANANCVAQTIGNYRKEGIGFAMNGTGWSGGYVTSPYVVTIDLISGFIVYLQVNARSIVLATKTNANYFGPIRAHWGDNAKAVAALPYSPHRRAMSPIELVVAKDGAQGVATTEATTTRVLGIAAAHHVNPIYPSDNPSYMMGQTYSGMKLRDLFQEYNNFYHASEHGYVQLQVAPSGVFDPSSNDAAFNDFQIHRMVMNGHTEIGVNFNAIGGAGVVPAIDIQDWYRFRGTATNESLALAADSVLSTTLVGALDATTAYTTLSLADASSLAPAGFIIVENEVFQYTGKSGNNLTGVTRAKYGSAQQVHWAGDAVYQGMWFTIINGGALFAGYVKPS